MISARLLARRALRIFGRVFPRCTVISQAVAFNLFLAFFPMLLVALAIATSSLGKHTALLDLIRHFTYFLPPGSRQVVSEFLAQRGPGAFKWGLIGWTGTLLVGAQVMALLVDGIRMIYGDAPRRGFWGRQFRGLFLLLATIAPLIAAAVLGILGRLLRQWLMAELGRPHALRGLWTFLFIAATLLLSFIALTVIYRVARSGERGFASVIPGALLATLLWWIVDVCFGFYVRKVPYSSVYGGLAAAIGLLIWMNLSTLVIFIGAACNAEIAERDFARSDA